jgi:hypothetical protein
MSTSSIVASGSGSGRTGRRVHRPVRLLTPRHRIRHHPFLQIIHEQKELLLPLVERHDGLLIKEEADRFLITSADRRRRRLRGRHAARLRGAQSPAHAGRADSALPRHWLRPGPSHRGPRRRGREVKAASRLGEDVARSGEILFTSAARAALTPRFDNELEALDEPLLRRAQLPSQSGAGLTRRCVHSPR